MTLNLIPHAAFLPRIHHLWETQWLLLSAGSLPAGDYNSMTVAWGSFGIMWGLPFAQVVVRPTRHTYGFMERYDSFTLCAFPESCRAALQLLGTKSGRDGDKISESGLTPVPATCVDAPAFDEAELVIECRKIYSQDFDPTRFLDPAIQASYPLKDYHRVYFGAVEYIRGSDDYGFAAHAAAIASTSNA
jgi:flavin reductase (DIM6/NTAB) family NADH-FMN oxidoreductase RutF